MKKYEFTGETLEYKGRTLKRIKRISDGLIGGWIQSENNLSHENDCFVYNDAKVMDSAVVMARAVVMDKAELYGYAIGDRWFWPR